MKTPKALMLGSLILMSVLYACKKNDSAPVPGKTDSKWSGETMKVKLKLSGDLQTTESPLGRQASNARINPDSTIYAVDVRLGSFTPYAQGIFTSLDSLTLNLPKGPFFTIRVAAIKKGSSLGLYEQSDNNGRFLPGRPLSRYITNRLSTDSTGPYKVDYKFLDTLSFFHVAMTPDTAEKYFNSELDTYYGDYQGYLTDSQASLTIPLKRFTYGIRFKPENFTDGQLGVYFDGLAAPKSLPVNNLAARTFTYTSDDYTYGDIPWRPLTVDLQWGRTNGTIQHFGSIVLHPKRNTLTTISITAPSNGIPLRISTTENTWQSDTTIVVK